MVVTAVTAREEDDPPEGSSLLSIGIRRMKKLRSIKGIELQACKLVVCWFRMGFALQNSGLRTLQSLNKLQMRQELDDLWMHIL